MDKMNGIMDTVDPDLMQLLKATEEYKQYAECLKVVETANLGQLHLSGTLGLQIDPNRQLGFCLNSKG